MSRSTSREPRPSRPAPDGSRSRPPGTGPRRSARWSSSKPICTMRSLTVGIPSGRVLPSPLGISTRLTGLGRYERSLRLSPSSRKVGLRARREPFDAYAVHPRRPRVGGDLAPRNRQDRGPDGLVNQRKPLASLDAVRQRRRHAPSRSKLPHGSRRGSRASGPCLALSGAAGPHRLLLSSQTRLPLASLPSLEAVLLSAPLTAPAASVL